MLLAFVISVHVSKGMPISAALRHAEANPELLDEWGRRNGVLKESRTRA